MASVCAINMIMIRVYCSNTHTHPIACVLCIRKINTQFCINFVFLSSFKIQKQKVFFLLCFMNRIIVFYAFHTHNRFLNSHLILLMWLCWFLFCVAMVHFPFISLNSTFTKEFQSLIWLMKFIHNAFYDLFNRKTLTIHFNFRSTSVFSAQKHPTNLLNVI